jgi:hypothetical protein
MAMVATGHEAIATGIRANRPTDGKELNRFRQERHSAIVPL